MTDLQMTINEGLVDPDYKELLTRFAALLLADLRNSVPGIKIVRASSPRKDGLAYRMELLSNGERVLFRFEGNPEAECASSL